MPTEISFEKVSNVFETLKNLELTSENLEVLQTAFQNMAIQYKLGDWRWLSSDLLRYYRSSKLALLEKFFLVLLKAFTEVLKECDDAKAKIPVASLYWAAIAKLQVMLSHENQAAEKYGIAFLKTLHRLDPGLKLSTGFLEDLKNSLKEKGLLKRYIESLPLSELQSLLKSENKTLLLVQLIDCQTAPIKKRQTNTRAYLEKLIGEKISEMIREQFWAFGLDEHAQCFPFARDLRKELLAAKKVFDDEVEMEEIPSP